MRVEIVGPRSNTIYGAMKKYFYASLRFALCASQDYRGDSTGEVYTRPFRAILKVHKVQKLPCSLSTRFTALLGNRLSKTQHLRLSSCKIPQRCAI